MVERQVAETARRFEDLSERVSRLRITEKSQDGMISVTVSANGLLTGLVLRERWHPLPAAEVAAQIMDCMHRAQARIPDLLRQTIHETVGTQDPSTHMLLDEARRRFPEPPPRQARSRAEPETEPKPAPAPRQRTSQPTDDDDWDGREVLEDVL